MLVSYHNVPSAGSLFGVLVLAVYDNLFQLEAITSDPVEEAQDEEADVSLDEMKDQEDTVSDETENQE